MMDILYYLIKVAVCSGILYLYYLLALRNKLFHQWNRFYLLSAVLISLAVPLLEFTIWNNSSDQQNQAIELLTVVGSANNYLDEVSVSGQSAISTTEWIIYAYATVSISLCLILIVSMFRIFAIIKTHAVQDLDQIKFINTHVKGTPFSFLKFIFWNREIDLQSETGQQIFQHELIHVKEKHTLDKLFMQILLILFWSNPFFWLIRKELRLVHEFIADKKSIAEHGTAALASMILQSAYPNRFNSITNQFFQTSIKRRLQMLAKIQNPRINYISRLLALPIIAITVLAFTLRTKNSPVPEIKLDKQFTVVIDAGHGKLANGGYNGARIENTIEDEIVLSIAKKIRELNQNDKIQIIFTRPSESVVELSQRVNIAKENNADLFISLHANANPKSPSASGIELVVSNKNTPYQKESEVFGSILVEELSKVYTTSQYLQKKQVGIYVLDKNICPTVLLECGYITNERDRQFIIKEENQRAIATKILTAIQRFAISNEGSIQQKADTIPSDIKSVDVNKNKNQITIEYKDGKKEVYQKDEASKNGVTIKNRTTQAQTGPTPLYVLDGEIFEEDLNTIDPNKIESVNVLKGASAASKYGDKGMNGVVEINTKKVNIQIEDTIPKVVFSRAEIEPAIDKVTWNKFLVNAAKPVIEKTGKNVPEGSYVVQIRFVVNTDGNLSNFKVMKDYHGLGEMILPEFRSAPKWSPALQNGKPVPVFHTQPVTFVITK